RSRPGGRVVGGLRVAAHRHRRSPDRPARHDLAGRDRAQLVRAGLRRRVPDDRLLGVRRARPGLQPQRLGGAAMTEPQGEQPQIQIAQIAAEMESEPLSRALWERAQYKVMAETFKAQNEL